MDAPNTQAPSLATRRQKETKGWTVKDDGCTAAQNIRNPKADWSEQTWLYNASHAQFAFVRIFSTSLNYKCVRPGRILQRTQHNEKNMNQAVI